MATSWQRTVMRLIGARERTVKVTSVEDVLPWYRRVHFSAPGFLRELDLTPTLWVRLWVPDPDKPSGLKQRGYTLVDPNPSDGTFALEFVLHQPTGPAARWASEVSSGDIAEIAFTANRTVLDPAVETFVLLGDTSALPAINSLITAVPPGRRAEVLLIGTDEASTLVRQGPGVRVRVVGSGAEQLALLRTLEIDGDRTYVWAAGERADVSAARALLRRDWKLPKERQHTQYYWMRDKPFG